MDVQKIRKDTARRAYNAGYDVVLLPSKCDLSVLLCRGARIAAGFLSFDDQVKNFENEDCYYEVGKKASFYMFADDLIKFTASMYN